MDKPYKSDDPDARLCDYCNESPALLYCRADSAKLCFSCDKEVHSTNQLFTKHSRSQLCDACDDSPASVFCETEKSVLCQNCDWVTHSRSSGSSSVHIRRPIEGFTGCPSVNELASIIGIDDLGEKSFSLGEKTDDPMISINSSSGSDEPWDLMFWKTPEIVSLNDLIVSSGPCHNFQASAIPPLPKNRNAACGKHKEEMLRQLRRLAKSDPNLNYDKTIAESDLGFQIVVSEGNVFSGFDDSFPSCQVSELQWLVDSDEAADQDCVPSLSIKSFGEEKPRVCDQVLDTSSGMNHVNGVHEENSQVPIASRTLPRHEINSVERDSALSRYKRKKKTRRYDKLIRYESRKVTAESRTRIRGRFARTDGRRKETINR